MPTTEVTWIGPDGAGGARLVDGGVLTLPGTLPGDVVRWREVRRRGRATLGEVERIETPSPDRIAPPCPHDSACGGCDLAALAPGARLRALGRMVGVALGRDPAPVRPSPRVEAHRARIKLAIAEGDLGYRGARSHELVRIDTCRIARPEIQAALPDLRAVLAAHPRLPLVEVEVRTDGEKIVHAFTATAPLDAEARAALAPLVHVAVDGRTIHGDPTLAVPVGPLRLRAGPDAFVQVNLEANEQLVAHVVAAILEVRPERVLDLYAGIGNLGLPVAAAGVPVVAVEASAPALRDLRATAAAHGIRGVETVAMDCARLDPSRHAYDAAILDPPRAGAGDVLGRILRNRPRRVVYVSCHVPAAARDLRAHAAGWRISDVTAFDLFPETRHVETVITLDRA